MKIRRVISSKNLPTRLPIFSTAVAYLLLDRFDAAQWVWGAVGLLYALLWIVCISIIIEQEEEDIFENK